MGLPVIRKRFRFDRSWWYGNDVKATQKNQGKGNMILALPAPDHTRLSTVQEESESQNVPNPFLGAYNMISKSIAICKEKVSINI